MSKPKFSVGECVYCYREESNQVTGFDFVGTVQHSANTGTEESPDWEYRVTNSPKLFDTSFPLLIWESEMSKAKIT